MDSRVKFRIDIRILAIVKTLASTKAPTKDPCIVGLSWLLERSEPLWGSVKDLVNLSG